LSSWISLTVVRFGATRCAVEVAPGTFGIIVIPVDQDLLRGLFSGGMVGAFDEFAVLEPRAGAYERDQMGCVHGAPV
jgi:hypothetical protein